MNTKIYDNIKFVNKKIKNLEDKISNYRAGIKNELKNLTIDCKGCKANFLLKDIILISWQTVAYGDPDDGYQTHEVDKLFICTKCGYWNQDIGSKFDPMITKDDWEFCALFKKKLEYDRDNPQYNKPEVNELLKAGFEEIQATRLKNDEERKIQEAKNFLKSKGINAG